MNDKTWMSANRLSDAYINDVAEFLRFYEKHMDKYEKVIRCPCIRCGNHRSFALNIVQTHLIAYGIMLSYIPWYYHGEVLISATNRTESVHEVKDDHSLDVDDMCGMVNDIEEDFLERPDLFESLLSDAETPLFSGCTKFSKLSFLVRLFHLKASGGWTDSSFNSLLQTLRDFLPEDNKVPLSLYEAKKTLSTLGMKYDKIHACINDCILYRNNYEDLDACPVCHESRWKKGKKPTSGVRGVPVKVLCYIPPIPRFRRLFNNAEHAENLVWHKEKRVDDGMLRHPADSAQWKSFDAEFLEFSSDSRNLHLALSTDGMNPFGNMSSRYSVWPVILVNYNLPPMLCMKRKFLMLTLLISGPQQPGNNIDVYLAPLIDDLKVLWEKGIEVMDAYRKESFKLRAM